MRTHGSWVSVGLLAAFVLSCVSYPPDKDASMMSARPLYPGPVISDSIRPDKGDKVDWWRFSYYESVNVHVSFKFGEADEPHKVLGKVELTDVDNNVLQAIPVVPGRRTYDFEFEARKEALYYFRVSARKGHAKYLVKAEVKPLDPCARCPIGTTCCKPTNACCAPGTICRQGACVNPNVCTPPCGPEDRCVDGRCVYGCPRPCGKGRRCDAERGVCTGVGPWRPRHPEPPLRDRPQCPPCGAGERCNPATGSCEPVLGDVIVGKVLTAASVGGGRVEILIDRGRKHGVKSGALGRVDGHKFRVKIVTPTRCRAVVTARPEAVKGKTVRIQR